jgi:hypothetical protein
MHGQQKAVCRIRLDDGLDCAQVALALKQGRQLPAHGNGYSESRPGAVGEASNAGRLCKKGARSFRCVLRLFRNEALASVVFPAAFSGAELMADR